MVSLPSSRRLAPGRVRKRGDISKVGGTPTGQLHLDQVVEIDDRDIDVAELDVEGTLAQLVIGAAAGNLVHHVDSAADERVERNWLNG